MSDEDWLLDFVGKVASSPRLLVNMITFAKRDELSAAAAAIRLVENPAVEVLGYAALARRSHERREEFLALAAKSAATLDPPSKVGVLTAIIDGLPEQRNASLRAQLARMIRALPAEDRKKYAELLRSRSARARPRLKRAASPGSMRSEVDLDVVASKVAKAYLRASRAPAARGLTIRPLGRAAARAPDVRFEEILASVRINLESLRISPPTPAADESAPAKRSYPEPHAPSDRIVSTGFADKDGLPAQIIVNPGERHYYFVEIGARVDDAQESGQALPADLKAGSVIDVVISTDDDGLAIEGPRSGRFRIEPSGAVVVSERAALPPTDDELLSRRMFFAFRAPPRARECGMRCSFYCRNLLIQSRRISVPVGLDRLPAINPDYVLSRTMAPAALARHEPPSLSVLGGTHSFRFYGHNGQFERSCTFDPLELRDLITRARTGFRQAAWGTAAEWTADDAYRFSAPRTTTTLLPDLLNLARRGRVLWDAVINRLAGGPVAAEELRELMRRSGHLQFALKERANSVLPIALFYDHELDTSRRDADMTLCDSFTGSLGRDLCHEPCMKGECPNRERKDIVCPGGFWGFRHAIGLPLSLNADQSWPPEPPPFITSAAPSIAIAVSTDPIMSRRIIHLANLQLETGLPQRVADTRDAALSLMASGGSPIMYFYCHGGLHEVDGPYLEVGPRNAPRIARNDLRPVRWERLRPIVFLNGCHTTRVAPEEALELVSAFVATCGASGVVGTEVTVFESLAAPFAEAFFEEFVTRGQSAGEAVRRARIRLLKDSLNPLGLVYVPFVLSSLRLGTTTTGAQP